MAGLKIQIRLTDARSWQRLVDEAASQGRLPRAEAAWIVEFWLAMEPEQRAALRAGLNRISTAA